MMRRRIVLMGESAAMLKGKAGERLLQGLDLPEIELQSVFDVLDLGIKEYPWPMARAKRKAAKMLPTLFARTVVFFGKRVAETFGASAPDLFTMMAQRKCGGVESRANLYKYILFPHPSSNNIWFKDVLNRWIFDEHARQLVRLAVGDPRALEWFRYHDDGR